jgi:hypothetical protein
LHPTSRIILYLLSALALPGLSFFVLAAVAASLSLMFRSRLASMLRLTWRARWLFLLLGFGYAYGLPGQAALPVLGDFSPSIQGARAGGLQALRLLLLLWMLDALVVGMGTQRMMAGLHGLFGGLRWLGFPAERATVRLGLTMQAMENNSLKLKDLTEVLTVGEARPPEAASFTLRHEPWRLRDTLAICVALVLCVTSALPIGSWLA